MSATRDRRRPPRGGARAASSRRHGWTIGVYVLLLVLVIYWRSADDRASGGRSTCSRSRSTRCRSASRPARQAIVIICGGIDLSVGSMMSLVNVVSAKYMLHMSFDEALLFSIAARAAGAALAGAITGLMIVVTRVADIIVTLAMLFVLGGAGARGAAGARRRRARCATRASSRSTPS